MILFGDAVKTMEIDAKTKGTVFFPNKENGSSMRRSRRTNKTNIKVLINELVESKLFYLGKRINHTNRRLRTLLNVDLQVIRLMQSKCVHAGFAEDVGKLIIFVRTPRKIHWRFSNRSSTSGSSQ